MYAHVFKYNHHHDKLGLFASGRGSEDADYRGTPAGSGGSTVHAGGFKHIFDNPIYKPIDKRLIDYKEKDRPLNDPAKTLDIEKALPHEKHKYVVPYSSTPFFDKLNKMQGTPDPMKVSVSEYVAARENLFNKQPIERLKIKDLIFTQTVVNKDKIASGVAKKKTNKGRPIFVVNYKNEDYVMDGHHDTVTRALLGKSHVEAHVLRIA